MTDYEILKWAHDFENRPHLNKAFSHWNRPPGSTSEDMRRLLDGGFVQITSQTSSRTWYKLTRAGSDLVWSQDMEKEMTKIAAENILDAMEIIIGFEDVKQEIAWGIEQRVKVNYLLIGPPAGAKSLFLEAIRASVPNAMMVFGASTTNAGLSDALFEKQPEFLLADELDKSRSDVYSVMLALLERGEILVTKSGKTRGIKLNTICFGACNSKAPMPPELLSRFENQYYFAPYTREEFIDVCCGFLSRSENCSPELAAFIGRRVFDLDLGDVRTARGICRMLREPTEAEVRRVVNIKIKYGEKNYRPQRTAIAQTNRMPGF